MKASLLALLLVGGISLPGWNWLVRVREHNAAQTQGQAAAQLGQTTEAAWRYGRAVALAGRGGPTPALLLNLAQAQAQAGQAAARATYARLLGPAVPAAIGSAARQQLAGLLATERQFAQAIGLLRQALRLDPTNAAARYNYELLSQYLAGQPPPALPPPGAPKPAGSAPDNQPEKDPAAQPDAGPTPAPQPGTARPGEAPDPSGPPAGGPGGAPQPSAAGGPPARPRPTPLPGPNAGGGSRPGGAGPARPVPNGPAGGSRRGLDAGAPALGSNAPAGQGRRPGTEAATDADLQLQTQRERLQALDLTPAQAQQLLDALRASEQQYLQQRPRPRAGTAPPPGQPTW